jgi:hypothetical protein
MYPEHICDEGDCTNYGVITFGFWADDYPKELYGKCFCVRHAMGHLSQRTASYAEEKSTCRNCGQTTNFDGVMFSACPSCGYSPPNKSGRWYK